MYVQDQHSKSVALLVLPELCFQFKLFSRNKKGNDTAVLQLRARTIHVLLTAQ